MSSTLDEIQTAIPHRPPFLFIDEIVSQDTQRIVCRKRFQGEEWFFAGHYPQQPIVPGVLLCEAALQAGAILLGQAPRDAAPLHRSAMPVVTRMHDVRFKQMVYPGDTIELEVTLRERLAGAFYFHGKVTVAGKLAVRLEFACMLVGEK